MNLTGTALERTSENRFYVKFKEKYPVSEDEAYEWKCWMIKKYFFDNVVVNLIRIAIGILLLTLAISSKIFKFLGNQGFGSIVVIICLCLGIILIGIGIMFSFSNYRCFKNYKDYLWDNESESNVVVSKIISFYNKAR